MAGRIASLLTVPFVKAISFAKERGVKLPLDYYDAVQTESRAHAFTVSHLQSLQQISHVLDELNRAIASGETYETWSKRVEAGGVELAPSHRETVFRNATQTAYSAGRRQEHIDNESDRPYLMYDAINDSRTREGHAAMDGFIAPVGHTVWKRWTPPNGHNCRCSVISLSERQAKARGFTGRTKEPDEEPDDGWDYDPNERGMQQKRLDAAVHRAVEKLPPAVRKASAKHLIRSRGTGKDRDKPGRWRRG